ncbi:MAG: ribonuclease P protein component [Acidimicrobiales bacterium]
MRPVVGRIRGRSAFRALARPSGRGRSGPIRVSFSPDAATCLPCVGYAIGRWHGNAVHRNRLRRRLRASVQAVVTAPEAPLRPGAYLVSADPAAARLTQSELARRVGEALARASTRRSGPSTPRSQLRKGPSS